MADSGNDRYVRDFSANRFFLVEAVSLNPTRNSMVWNGVVFFFCERPGFPAPLIDFTKQRIGCLPGGRDVHAPEQVSTVRCHQLGGGGHRVGSWNRTVGCPCAGFERAIWSAQKKTGVDDGS